MYIDIDDDHIWWWFSKSCDYVTVRYRSDAGCYSASGDNADPTYDEVTFDTNKCYTEEGDLRINLNVMMVKVGVKNILVVIVVVILDTMVLHVVIIGMIITVLMGLKVYV